MTKIIKKSNISVKHRKSREIIIVVEVLSIKYKFDIFLI